MNIKVSLLVPTLGEREAELRRLFDSLTKQSYLNMEVIVVSQDNHQIVDKLCAEYSDILTVKHLKSDIKGLSLSRNIGLSEVTGEITVLSDDDCWYPSDAMSKIVSAFTEKPQTDVLLTQIYDPISDSPYKKYDAEPKKINRITDLLSRSSIELAFSKRDDMEFDERFGLGARYVSGEENDFLVSCFRAGMNIFYKPEITVFHQKKTRQETDAQLNAKGAFYAKNFGFLISNAVLLRDLLKKHQNNYREFWNGYFDFKKNKRLP